jgi:hypothetical protein
MGGLRHEKNVEQFLEVLARTGIVRDAARAVGISHTNAYHWRARIPGFGERWDAAMKEGQKTIGAPAKATLFQLGVVGVLEPVRDKAGNIVWDDVDAKGKPVPPNSKKKTRQKMATRRVYNMRALELVLKAAFPNEFADKVKVDGEIAHTHRAEEMSEDELRRIASQGRNRIAEAN